MHDLQFPNDLLSYILFRLHVNHLGWHVSLQFLVSTRFLYYLLSHDDLRSGVHDFANSSSIARPKLLQYDQVLIPEIQLELHPNLQRICPCDAIP